MLFYLRFSLVFFLLVLAYGCFGSRQKGEEDDSGIVPASGAIESDAEFVGVPPKAGSGGSESGGSSGNRRSVETVADASSSTDDAAMKDARSSIPDAQTSTEDGTVDPCDEPHPPFKFTMVTSVAPTQPSLDLEQYDVSGTVGYSGPPQDRDYSSWDREVQIQGPDGEESSLFYTFSLGSDNPLLGLDSLLTDGRSYDFTYLRSIEVGVLSDGLVVKRRTSGFHPLVLVAESGDTLRNDGDLMSPLTVVPTDGTRCPPETDTCGTKYRDALRFTTMSGGIATEIVLEEGESDTLPVFGSDFLIIHLGAGHYEDDTGLCVDYLFRWRRFLAIRQEG